MPAPTSVTTRIDRALFCRKPVPDRPLLSFSVVVRSVFELWSAGIRPKRTPVPSDTANAKPSTRQSRPTIAPNSPTRGSPAVFTDSSARMPIMPRTIPRMPPTSDSTTLSVSSWRMMRPRDPPIAARMAISRRRPVARTSRRFATLAQAISRTKLTAPPSTSSDDRTFRTSTSRIG